MKRKPAAVKNFATDSSIGLLNRQRTRPIDLPHLRRMVRHLLTTQRGRTGFDIVIHLINTVEMTRLNETRLRHAGSTDVITFDFSDDDPLLMLAGEIFVCVDEALIQAKLFKVAWQTELVRYIVHGILHLQGYDDTRPALRRRMKAEENRLVQVLATEFDLSKLHRKPRVTA